MCSLLRPSNSCYRFRHADLTHVCCSVTPSKVASRWYFVCVINTKMRDSAFIPYKRWGKTAQIIPAWTILPAYSPSVQASSWHYLGWNLRHYTNDYYGSVLRSYTDRKQTLRRSSSTLHYHCSEVSRADNTRLVHGTRLPLNYALDLIPPSVTCRGVTALSIITHCTHHYTL